MLHKGLYLNSRAIYLWLVEESTKQMGSLRNINSWPERPKTLMLENRAVDQKLKEKEKINIPGTFIILIRQESCVGRILILLHIQGSQISRLETIKCTQHKITELILDTTHSFSKRYKNPSHNWVSS